MIDTGREVSGWRERYVSRPRIEKCVSEEERAAK